MVRVPLSSRMIFTGPTNESTILTGETTLLSREMLESSLSIDEKVLLMNCADDNSSTPTIKVDISLNIAGTWTEYEQIHAASVVPKEIKISSYSKSWWLKNSGVRFKITKAGAGAVTITGANWE